MASLSTNIHERFTYLSNIRGRINKDLTVHIQKKTDLRNTLRKIRHLYIIQFKNKIIFQIKDNKYLEVIAPVKPEPHSVVAPVGDEENIQH